MTTTRSARRARTSPPRNTGLRPKPTGPLNTPDPARPNRRVLSVGASVWNESSDLARQYFDGKMSEYVRHALIRFNADIRAAGGALALNLDELVETARHSSRSSA